MLVLRILFLFLFTVWGPLLAKADDPKPAVDGIVSQFTIEAGFNHNALGRQDYGMLASDAQFAFPISKIFANDELSNIGASLRLNSQILLNKNEEFLTVFGQAYLFWRDPEIGNFGINMQIGEADHLGYFAPALQGAMYFGPFDISGTVSFIDGELYRGTAYFAGGSVGVHIIDNLYLSAGYGYTDIKYSESVKAISWRAEWLAFPNNPLGVSVLTRGRYHVGRNRDSYQVLFGASFYWGGQPKTLLRRQREDAYR